MKALSKKQRQYIEKQKKIEPNYKTELCKSMLIYGYCKYSYKCKFAHFESELIERPRSANYKKILCNSFFIKGYCIYGSRCHFIHNQIIYSNLSKPLFFNNVYFIRQKCQKRLKVFEQITSNYNIKDYCNNIDNSDKEYNSYNSSTKSASNTLSDAQSV